eukprot:11883745-Ditylum_brightwellii.AAC.1
MGETSIETSSQQQEKRRRRREDVIEEVNKQCRGLILPAGEIMWLESQFYLKEGVITSMGGGCGYGASTASVSIGQNNITPPDMLHIQTTQSGAFLASNNTCSHDNE